jgi:hypothetical protein
VPAYFFTARSVPSTGADVNTSVGTVQMTSSWNVVSVAPVLVTVAVHPLPGGDGHSGRPSWSEEPTVMLAPWTPPPTANVSNGQATCWVVVCPAGRLWAPLLR